MTDQEIKSEIARLKDLRSQREEVVRIDSSDRGLSAKAALSSKRHPSDEDVDESFFAADRKMLEKIRAGEIEIIQLTERIGELEFQLDTFTSSSGENSCDGSRGDLSPS